MKVKLLLLLCIIAINSNVNSQDFELIDNYHFVPKIELNNNMLGFAYANYNSSADFISTNCTTNGVTVLTPNLSNTANYNRPKGLDWIVYNNKVYFSAENVSGDELWVTDGTANGTYMVKDILPEDGTPGTKFGYPKYFKAYNGKFYFSGRASGTYDYTDQLWESDGTENGTQIVTILPYGNLDTSSEFIPDPCKFTVLNNKLYFQAYDNEIWETDGTAAGTIEIKNIGFGHRILSEIISFQNNFLFITYKYINNVGSIYNLWISDGTTTGTFVLQELFDDEYRVDGDYTINMPQTNRNFILFNNKVYFITGENLRVTDGTVQGTTVVKDFGSYANNNTEVILYDDKLFFIRGNALWESDGTESGTTIIKTLPSWYHNTLRISNDLLYFFSYDTNIDSNNLYIWESNGTTQGTNVVGSPVINTSNIFNVNSLFSYNNAIYSSTYTPNSNQQLTQFWRVSTTPLNVTNYNINETFSVFPNPVDDIFTINSDKTVREIKFYNSIGQRIISTSNKNIVNISSLVSGVYFVKIEFVDGSKGTKKIVKS